MMEVDFATLSLHAGCIPRFVELLCCCWKSWSPSHTAHYCNCSSHKKFAPSQAHPYNGFCLTAKDKSSQIRATRTFVEHFCFRCFTLSVKKPSETTHQPTESCVWGTHCWLYRVRKKLLSIHFHSEQSVQNRAAWYPLQQAAPGSTWVSPHRCCSALGEVLQLYSHSLRFTGLTKSISTSSGGQKSWLSAWDAAFLGECCYWNGLVLSGLG